jgi:NAD(P)-dependent dehydrogenase (short-subunit alcohol dehydrogenase family)
MEKRFLVTGHSKGIGREVCQQLLQRGCEVVGLSRSASGMTHPLLKEYAVDMADVSDWGNQVKAWASHGKLDGVLHNAGLLVNKPFEELTPGDWQRVYAANVFGPAELTRVLLPHIRTGGHVVFVSSMGGLAGSSKYPGLSAYSSSKGAVSIMAEVLHAELKERVVVNALALGAAQTEMLAQAFPGYRAPIGAAEMAEWVSWFLEHGGRFFGGQTLPVALGNP